MDSTTRVINRHIPESVDRCVPVASGEHYWGGRTCLNCGAERVPLFHGPIPVGHHGDIVVWESNADSDGIVLYWWEARKRYVSIPD